VLNRGFCMHVLAQFRKFEPNLLAENDCVRANTLLILISRTLNMMDKYLRSLGDEFTRESGFKERMTAVRGEARAQTTGSPETGPACPKCGAETRLRHTRKDNRPFWGCTNYPGCDGIVNCRKAPGAEGPR
jgi:four helix bundle suffix protein